MTELAVEAVLQYTGGRLEDDDETAALLARGLAAARRFCGWHITPEREDLVTIDGPGGRLLVLPTLHLVTLTEVTEDGDDVDVADLYVSARGLVQKKSRGCWSTHYGAITVTMTHGFAEAPDFESAVLSWIDRASFAASGGRARVVGPFQWETESLAVGSTFTAGEQALLEQYRLERPA